MPLFSIASFEVSAKNPRLRQAPFVIHNLKTTIQS
jgi:hypothetical protein